MVPAGNQQHLTRFFVHNQRSLAYLSRRPAKGMMTRRSYCECVTGEFQTNTQAPEACDHFATHTHMTWYLLLYPYPLSRKPIHLCGLRFHRYILHMLILLVSFDSSAPRPNPDHCDCSETQHFLQPCEYGLQQTNNGESLRIMEFQKSIQFLAMFDL